jgi:DNA-binding GntR family transcriptional regulator
MKRYKAKDEYRPMKPISKISKRSLRDDVYSVVRDAIINGHFMPGSAITIMGLSEMVGTSPMPVREALRQLTAEGALEIMPNRTIAVPLLTRSEFDDLTALRCHLECIVAVRALPNLTADSLNRLDRLNMRMKKAREDRNLDKHLRLNWEFHSTLYKESNSHFFIDLIEKLWLKIGPLIRFALQEVDFSNAAAYHQSTVAALRSADEAQIRKSIELDIVTAAEQICARYQFRTAD